MTTASSVVVAMMGRARADVIDRVSAQEARARDLAQQIEARVREIEARLSGDLAEVRALVSDTRERSVPRAEHQSEIGALRGELHEMRRDVHRVAATQVRLAVACHRSTPAATLAQLASDADVDVRCAVARHRPITGVTP